MKWIRTHVYFRSLIQRYKNYLQSMMWPNNDMHQGSSEPSLGFRRALAHIIFWCCLAPAAQGLKTQYIQTISLHTWVTTHTCASLLITTVRSLKESHDFPILDADAASCTYPQIFVFFCSFILRSYILHRLV